MYVRNEWVRKSVNVIGLCSLCVHGLWPPMTFATWLLCSEPRSARPVQNKALRHTQTPDSHSVPSDVTSQAVTPRTHKNPDSLFLFADCRISARMHHHLMKHVFNCSYERHVTVSNVVYCMVSGLHNPVKSTNILQGS